MQQQLAEHVRSTGVRGFVAEILPSNAPMIRLTRQGSVNVVTEQPGGTVRVTTLL